MKNSALKEKEENYVRPKPNLDPLSYNGGPITRTRAKKMKEAIVGLILLNLENMLNSQSQQVKGQSQQVKGQRSRSTHGPKSKPNTCALDPSNHWAEIHIHQGSLNSAITCKSNPLWIRIVD